MDAIEPREADSDRDGTLPPAEIPRRRDRSTDQRAAPVSILFHPGHKTNWSGAMPGCSGFSTIRV